MASSWIRSTLVASIVLGAGLVIGCTRVQGNYRDSDGAVTLEMKDGKCNLTIGPERIPCTYTVDGDKVTLAPTIGDKSQTIVLTVKDGSLVGPPGGLITKLDKVK
jgi:hypothetical protein